MLDSCGAAGVARTWLTLRWLPALFDDIAQHTMPSQAPASPRRRAAVFAVDIETGRGRLSAPGFCVVARSVATSTVEAKHTGSRTSSSCGFASSAANSSAPSSGKASPATSCKVRNATATGDSGQSGGQAFQPVLHGQAHAQRQVADKAQGAPCGAPGPVRQRSAQPAAHRGRRHSTASRRGTTSRAQSASRVDPAPLPARPG